MGSPRFAYVGCRTTRERNARGEGIGVFRIGPDDALLPVQVFGGLVNPSYLTLDRAGERLYAVHGDGHAVSVLAIDPSDGTLHLLQQQDCGGRNLVHLALDPAGTRLVVSDHLGDGSDGGTVVVLPVETDGKLGPVLQRLHLPGNPGPHRQEQPFAKPHSNPFDPSGRWVVVPDKGQDRIFVFVYADGRLQPAADPWVATRAGAGPRHIAFHLAGPWAYVVNELDSTVTAYRFDHTTGGLAPFQCLSCLPDSFTGDSRAAGIELAQDGRTLYVSNRGNDSITVLRIEPSDGRLAFIESGPSGGRTPRFFALAPGGRSLYALNEDSDTIVRFDVASASGRLVATNDRVGFGSPTCMVFSR